MQAIFINYFTNIAKYSIGNTTNTIAHRHQVKKEIVILFAFLSMTSKAFPRRQADEHMSRGTPLLLSPKQPLLFKQQGGHSH